MIVTLRHKRKDPWAGVTKYKGCFDYISPLLSRSGNAHTGLEKEDSERLEAALHLTPGTLLPYSKYWNTFAVKITNKELVLNTEMPWDELQYLFLKNHSKVANSISDSNPGATWVLINKEIEAQEANKSSRRRREAIKEFDKMSINDMRKCLRLLGIKSDGLSNELIENRTYDFVEKEPDKFFAKWVDNKTKETEYIIEAAISKNIIRRSRNIYYYGTEVIGNSMDDTIVHLNDKKNQDLKLAIMNDLESK
jgi:hypothetical protein